MSDATRFCSRGLIIHVNNIEEDNISFPTMRIGQEEAGWVPQAFISTPLFKNERFVGLYILHADACRCTEHEVSRFKFGQTLLVCLSTLEVVDFHATRNRSWIAAAKQTMTVYCIHVRSDVVVYRWADDACHQSRTDAGK